MALMDITVLSTPVTNLAGNTFRCTQNTTVIKAGEPVSPAVAGIAGLNSTAVIAAVTSSPILSTTSGFIAWVGIAANTSTQTTTAEGTVDVYPLIPGTTYLVAPLTASSWNTQAKYNALVGSRVLIDLTGTTYTIAATDSYVNGLVVMPLDISKYPGKVAFQIKRSADTYTS